MMRPDKQSTGENFAPGCSIDAGRADGAIEVTQPELENNLEITLRMRTENPEASTIMRAANVFGPLKRAFASSRLSSPLIKSCSTTPIIVCL